MKPVILTVDDEPINLDLMEAVLLPEGFIIEQAANGQEALDKVKAVNPDLILLDIMMPDIDGFEVCRRIRADTSIPYIPIVFVTAKSQDPEDMIHGLDIGADDYIRKPYNPPELMSRVRSALRVKDLINRLFKVKSELSRYVSLSTLEMVEKALSGEVLRAGEAKEVTVLFSDIRGFTSLSERMDPEKVFEMLNLYLSKQIQVIERHHGIVDKLSGDEIMAIFEGPKKVENALHCAAAIIQSICGSHDGLSPEWVGVGIGINTGPVYVGSIGSETIKDFTVVGNTVNIAARLCGCAQKFQVVFTEATRKFIDENIFKYQLMAKVRLKGISEELVIYRLALGV